MPRVTVVLDESCAALREAVAAFAPVILFTRRRGFLATAAVDASEELRLKLTAEAVVPPYVFVAASFGGFTALAHAARYPAGLAGLVLVDSSHPLQSAVTIAAVPPAELATPAGERFKHYLQGFGAVWTESCATVAEVTALGVMPVIVLAAGRPEMPAEFSDKTKETLTCAWHDLQRRHAALSTRGELRIVPGQGHNIVAGAPDAILAAVAELCECVATPSV